MSRAFPLIAERLERARATPPPTASPRRRPAAPCQPPQLITVEAPLPGLLRM